MGKGDKKTRRGKIIAASYGNVRPRSKGKKVVGKKTTSTPTRGKK
jgi:ribosomal small subunit protein bTHX